MSNINNDARPEDETLRKIFGDELFDSLSVGEAPQHEKFGDVISGLEAVRDEIDAETQTVAGFPNEAFQSYRADLTTFLKSLSPGVRIGLLTALLFDEAHSGGGVGAPLTTLAVEKLVTTLDEEAAEATGLPVENFLQASIERIVGDLATVTSN